MKVFFYSNSEQMAQITLLMIDWFPLCHLRLTHTHLHTPMLTLPRDHNGNKPMGFFVLSFWLHIHLFAYLCACVNIEFQSINYYIRHISKFMGNTNQLIPTPHIDTCSGMAGLWSTKRSRSAQATKCLQRKDATLAALFSFLMTRKGPSGRRSQIHWYVLAKDMFQFYTVEERGLLRCLVYS